MHRIFKYIIVSILSWEAKCVLMRHKPFIIAVTGSVGKTSTKDAIFQILRDTTSVRKSQKSFNSEIGVPLTILGLENAWRNPLGWLGNISKGFFLAVFPSFYPKLLVLEVGADHPGDIKRISRWLKPNIAVVTRIPDRPVHVENFASAEELKKEKGELVRALSENGVFVVNADDLQAMSLKEETRATRLTYGFGETAQLRGSAPEIHYEGREGRKIPVGMTFQVDWRGSNFPVQFFGAVGTQSCTAVLAALAVGLARKLPLDAMVKSISMLQPEHGRMRVISGRSGSIIIDDSYNSSPVAVEAALETLKQIKANHRIAMLGDMLELGEWSEEEHWRIGRIAGGFVDELVTVGRRAKGIAEGAKTAGLQEGKIHAFSNAKEAGEWLHGRIKTDDVILVKGSQGSGEDMIRMERAIEHIMAHPEDAPQLLVRQDREWLDQYKTPQ